MCSVVVVNGELDDGGRGLIGQKDAAYVVTSHTSRPLLKTLPIFKTPTVTALRSVNFLCYVSATRRPAVPFGYQRWLSRAMSF